MCHRSFVVEGTGVPDASKSDTRPCLAYADFPSQTATARGPCRVNSRRAPPSFVSGRPFTQARSLPGFLPSFLPPSPLLPRPMDLPTTPSVTAALSLGERHHQLEAGPLQPGPTFHAQAPVSTSFASPAANTSWAEASTSAVLKRPRDEDDFAAAAASSFPDACSSTSSNVSGDASKRVRFEHCAPLPTHDAREERLSRLRLKGRQLRLRHGPVATLKAPEVVLPAFSHDELVALHRSGDHHLRAGSTSGTTSTALPVIVPQTTPPITLRTLSELSFESMLSDVHLRHDIVFEPTLRFRPNVDGARCVLSHLHSRGQSC